jgi:CHAT domain-containing protein/Tfp pilus assembly protein PilF
MKYKILLLIVLNGTFAHAQFGDLLKKGLEKGKKVAEKKLVQTGKEIRNKLDSTDFSYAITVIDNSGMMDTRDATDQAIKDVNLAVNLYKGDDQASPEEKSRNILDGAEKLYGFRKFKPAEAVFLDAKLSYEANNLTDNINYSRVYADMGLLYATMGRYQTAEEYTTEGLSMREKTWGVNSLAYASSLNNTGVLYQETARYNEAEKYFEQALQTLKDQGAAEKQECAIVLNNEAILFSKIGRYDGAIDKLNKAIALMNGLKKKDLSNQIGFQSNLALLYQQTGKFGDAESIYLRLEKELGSKNPYYAGVINNLALLYIQMGKLDKVEGYLKQSATVYKDKFGASNPNYAKVQNDLGNFYRTQGKMADAEKALTEALTIRSSVLGNLHPDYVKSEEDMGILYWKKGDLAKANTFLLSAMGKSMDFITQYFPPMSEAEKTKYWDVLQPRFQRFYNYCLDAYATNPAIARDMYNYQMATKGLLLSSTNKVKARILASGKADLIKDYTAWLDKKETLARYYSLSNEDLKNQKIDLAALEQEANNMERSLSQQSEEFSQGYETAKPDFQQIIKLLGDKEAVVEIIRIQLFDKAFTTGSKYAALVLTKNSPDPKLIILDNGEQLETRYAKFYRNSIQQKTTDTYSYDQFWARIEAGLTGKTTIYFSPDGVYNQINLNTLKKADGSFVINQFDLVIVGNSKDLIGYKNKKVAAAKKNAFLLGFPEYGGTAVAALPGTKIEIDGVSRTLKASGYQVSQYTQLQATEKQLKSVKGPSLVHIATHGYFMKDVDGGGVGVASENAKNNPLLRSGILLAGASKTISGEQIPNLESNDNGVLTAYEAMNLNLEGTDLIVLSACETGLGDVKSGEGVYGLQRAFLVAGADAMIMSLWKVDDAATQQLMTNFYTNWTKGGSKLKAFKQAQLQLMTKFKEPYYWGAFVMMGM